MFLYYKTVATGARRTRTSYFRSSYGGLVATGDINLNVDLSSRGESPQRKIEVVYIFKVIMTCETDSYLHVFSIKTIGRESLLETLL